MDEGDTEKNNDTIDTAADDSRNLEREDSSSPDRSPKLEIDNDLDDLFGSESEKEDDSPKKNEVSETKARDDFIEDDMEVENSNAFNQQDEEEETREYGPPEVIHYAPLPKPDKNHQLFQVRLPNILGLEPYPFDPQTYEEVKDTRNVDEEDTSNKKLQLNPETVIRWRYVKDPNTGELVRETNSRFVRWSDGSIQLFVGSEVYDVAQQDMTQANHYLFTRQKGFIKCHGHLLSKLIFRPSSLGSKSHQKLTNWIVKSHQKEKRIKLVTTEKDPEKDKAEREEAEMRRIRASEKLQSMQQRQRRKYSTNEGLSEDMLESGEYDEDYEKITDEVEEEDPEGNIGAIKAKYGKGKIKEAPRRSYDEDAERKILKAKESAVKAVKGKRQEEEIDERLQEEPEEESVQVVKKKGRKRILDDE